MDASARKGIHHRQTKVLLAPRCRPQQKLEDIPLPKFGLFLYQPPHSQQMMDAIQDRWSVSMRTFRHRLGQQAQAGTAGTVTALVLMVHSSLPA
jgi:hypothetical protein